MKVDGRFRSRLAQMGTALRAHDEELIEPPHRAGEAVNEREPNRAGWPVDHVRDPVSVSDEVRIEVASLERAVLVGMGVSELRQVVEEELPKALSDLVSLLRQFDQVDHLRIVGQRATVAWASVREWPLTRPARTLLLRGCLGCVALEPVP